MHKKRSSSNNLKHWEKTNRDHQVEAKKECGNGSSSHRRKGHLCALFRCKFTPDHDIDLRPNGYRASRDCALGFETNRTLLRSILPHRSQESPLLRGEEHDWTTAYL